MGFLKQFSFYWLVYRVISYIYIGFELTKLENPQNNIIAN